VVDWVEESRNALTWRLEQCKVYEHVIITLHDTCVIFYMEHCPAKVLSISFWISSWQEEISLWTFCCRILLSDLSLFFCISNRQVWCPFHAKSVRGQTLLPLASFPRGVWKRTTLPPRFVFLILLVLLVGYFESTAVNRWTFWFELTNAAWKTMRNSRIAGHCSMLAR